MPNDEDDLEDENIGDVQGLKVFIGTINNDLIPIDDLEDMDLAGG
jgi:hypothetical protein